MAAVAPRLWAGLAAAGVLMLTQPWLGVADPAGVAFALSAAACWAAYILLTARVGEAVSGIKALAVSMPVAGLTATVVVLVSGRAALFADLTPSMLLAGLGLAAVLPVVPFILELSVPAPTVDRRLRHA